MTRDWQTIDTAPPGICALVAVPGRDGDYQIGVGEHNTYAYKAGGWWQWESDYWPHEITPTHWMPLPEPPKAAR